VVVVSLFFQNKDLIFFNNLLIGKSTCLSLLLRYYELSSGQIKIGDRSITNYNLKQLRQNIAVVNQEPVDFSHIFL
jgi:putative ABC transport system ATP-binding protein